MLWRALYDTPAYKQLFDEVDELHITRSIPTTMELLLERIRTKSYVSLLDAPTRERLLDRVQDLFAQQSDTQLGRQWLDKDTGVWAYPYRTGAWRDGRRRTDSRPASSAAQVARSAQVQRAVKYIELGRKMRGTKVAFMDYADQTIRHGARVPPPPRCHSDDASAPAAADADLPIAKTPVTAPRNPSRWRTCLKRKRVAVGTCSKTPPQTRRGTPSPKAIGRGARH